MICLCGAECEKCEYFGASCDGCAAISGKVFWAGYMGSDICPIYNCCVNEKGLEHCGKCDELPCRIYFDARDPRMSEEEHRANIEQRAGLLKKR